MATLALSYAGGALGTALGGPLGGAIGKGIGAIAGAFIDNKLFANKTTKAQVDPNRYKVTTSTEGKTIPRLYGRARVGGQIIWSTYFLRIKAKSSGGKGSVLSPSSSAQQQAPQDKFYANWAVALCEGPITRIGQVWADGKPINLANYIYRLYYGTEDQLPDGLIVSKEGAENTSAYRGLAYIVFELMELTAFGNRLPQITVEVFRAVDDLEGRIQAITMIPAAGEFAYDTIEVIRNIDIGVTAGENINTNAGASDFEVSLNDLNQTLPNARTISLFVSWFGSDLRAANCAITPKVENRDKDTSPYEWAVAGLDRSSAPVVSTAVTGGPAFGGTPSDISVINAIFNMRINAATHAGTNIPLLSTPGNFLLPYQVAFTPFMLMDIPFGNTLPDPIAGGVGQPLYPWRGRITKQFATPDKSAGVAAEVAAFVGTAQPSQFFWNGATVIYTGPAEWSYRRFILHYATLCAVAGGVDIFVLGTELRGLTWLRSAAGTYPFVTALKALAADVKSILPGAKVVYAADWSEWFGHQPADGSGDVYFHLDPLWTDSHVDAIGIDNYWPLGDWRDGNAHADYAAGFRDPRDDAYLRSNIQGGEGFDWFYASLADRNAQIRTPITDGAFGKPWVFRFKDVKSWWENQHINRPGGAESGDPTAWVPQSKPVWFMEMGCPAIDRGGNQPNVFFDAKSSESSLPYFSRGNRDDLMQRRFLKAMLGYFDPSDGAFVDANNPVSAVYGGRMVDPAHVFVYTWDARPYPAFPGASQLWADAANWQFGHWLTGRMGGAPMAQTVGAILNDAGFTDYNSSALTGSAQGYLVEQVTSPRTLIEPLEMGFFFDSIESDGQIVFRQRGLAGPVASFDRDHMVETSANAAKYEIDRAQETELPRVVKLTYTDANKSYHAGAVDARRIAGRSSYVAQASLPVVMDFDQATIIAETWLHETWAARETLSLSLPPSKLFLEAGDTITVDAGGMNRDYRITDLTIGSALQIQASSIEPHIYGRYDPAIAPTSVALPASFGPPVAAFMDLPLITGQETPYAGRLAAFASPWPGAEAFYRSASSTGFVLNTLATSAASMGETQFQFFSGPTSRFDDGNVLRVRLYNGELASVDDVTLLNGANTAAIETSPGVWEIVQFGNAALISPGVYDLSHFLRGQYGTEAAMGNPAPVAARFVVLDAAVIEASMTAADRGLAYNWKVGPASFDIGSPSYVTMQETFTGVGLRPYSPAHIAGARDGSGNITISWIRRDRDPAADSWEQTEIPMSEASEAYEIDILNGGTVVRTLSVGAQTAFYSAAQQTADFGTAQSSISLRICQMSQTFGRGSPGSATV